MMDGWMDLWFIPIGCDSSGRPHECVSHHEVSCSHADLVQLFPELCYPTRQRQLRQAPALSGGEPHQRRAFRADPVPPSQLCDPCRDEGGGDMTVRLSVYAERRPRFTRVHVPWIAPCHALHITGDFHSALVWQSQNLHPWQASRGGLPDGRSDAASQCDVLRVDGDVAVHDVRAGPHTCSTSARDIFNI